VSETTTRDALLAGRVVFHQPVAGYRVAIDPVLLAAAVEARPGERVLDAGSGSGAASLCLAARLDQAQFIGVERNRELHRLAVRNVTENDFARRVDLINGDLHRPPPRLGGISFDHVMTNPPFLQLDATTPPANGRSTAHVESESEGGLEAWLLASLRPLRPGGSLTLVHRADRLADVLAALHGRVGDLVVFPLWPRRSDRPAKRILIRGRKSRKGPLRLSPGLVLHEADGSWTPSARAILERGAPLPLGGGDLDG
jgi:tRNA1(Val) A37 N6-methylase TrmN6